MAEFKDRLKQIRKEKDVTLEDIEKDLGITNSAISKWENGIRDPKLSNVIALAKYFDVSIDWLSGMSDDKNSFVTNAINKAINSKISQDDIVKCIEMVKNIKGV